MTEPASPPKPRRGMLGFYVAGLVLVALAGLGAWFWTAWGNWQFDEPEARRRQAEAARQLGLPVETAIELPPSPSAAAGPAGTAGGGVALELVLIPAGMFNMGSPDDEAGRDGNEGPLHRVRIGRPFYIGKYEVSQEVWENVMGANPSRYKEARNPVESVSWNECQEFMRKLNELVPDPLLAPNRVWADSQRVPTGGRGGYAFRLPTEAEWEWACRAGTKTRFCCGDSDARLGDYAWYSGKSGYTTHLVGEKLPNAWGLHDCHGNVWEWCADWYGEYSANPWPGKFRWTRDPQGPATGPGRVLRGGGWWDAPAKLCRSASRDFNDPAARYHFGFRVALSIPGP